MNCTYSWRTAVLMEYERQVVGARFMTLSTPTLVSLDDQTPVRCIHNDCRECDRDERPLRGRSVCLTADISTTCKHHISLTCWRSVQSRLSSAQKYAFTEKSIISIISIIIIILSTFVAKASIRNAKLLNNYSSLDGSFPNNTFYGVYRHEKHTIATKWLYRVAQ